jgi:hypothetical protein
MINPPPKIRVPQGPVGIGDAEVFWIILPFIAFMIGLFFI